MRDERWVHRFPYTWNDTLFFDPLDTVYRPSSDHFLSGCDAAVRERFVRAGVRWVHRTGRELPEQGWIIHVSVSPREAPAIAPALIRHLTGRGSDFEIALDATVHALLNSRAASARTGSELATVHPRDEEDFRTCLAELDRLLAGAEGAPVPSDQRYRDSRALSFRYGRLRGPDGVDVLGRPLRRILGPDGPAPDDRYAGPAHPDWPEWPFDDWKPAPEDEGDGLLGGRFRVTGAVRFSHSGGVYTAEDTADGGRPALVREARPHTGIDPRQGHDAVDALDREWMFLNLLAAVGSFPAPVARFRQGEHHYTAQELIGRPAIGPALLARHPLLRAGAGVTGSREYLRIFLTVFGGLARAVLAAHDRGVVLAELTAGNVLLDPDTLEVSVVGPAYGRLLDGGGPAAGGDGPAAGGDGLAEDRRALARTMAHLLLPVTGMAYLCEDLLARYRGLVTEGLGWPERVHRLLSDLAGDRIGLEDVLRAVEDGAAELLAGVRAVAPRPVAGEGRGLREAEAGVAAFVEATADTGRDTLFPVDPFAHATNPLSLGSGASGVLWALHASGLPLDPAWRDWLAARLADIDPERYPDGLMNGLAGIAWAADELGLGSRARQLLTLAGRRVLGRGDHTFHHGLAGVGMTHLRFFLRHRDPAHLAAARSCAQALCGTVRRDGALAYWLNDFSTDGPLSGLGFGQAGVAMFLLRMHQITGEERHLRLGREALAWETAHTWETSRGGSPADGEGPLMFDPEGSADPSVEAGAAGVAKVLLRYGDLGAARTVLRGLGARYAALPGYASGLSGVADTLLDAAAFTGDGAYRAAALRQLGSVRELFLFAPAERSGLPGAGLPRPGGRALLALPGDGLLRCSTDYLTGSAGLLRVLHRVNSGGTADFLLDEVGL
ncbi:lanthionine synthetase LanC family protein [Streptomyces sp. NPDC047014]|uniref:class III lanthionine synthetase LanKC N-terminal domain-containing protein n=1 Tax=Streptomyces sp. NPDC047014 TaxID=3155736 RepID=UPI0033FF874F